MSFLHKLSGLMAVAGFFPKEHYALGYMYKVMHNPRAYTIQQMHLPGLFAIFQKPIHQAKISEEIILFSSIVECTTIQIIQRSTVKPGTRTFSTFATREEGRISAGRAFSLHSSFPITAASAPDTHLARLISFSTEHSSSSRGWDRCRLSLFLFCTNS